MLRVEAMDHIVLVVADVERSLAWYQDELGLAGERVEDWRAGRVPFPSVRVSPTTVIDLIAGREPDQPRGRDLDHLCLVVAPTDLAELAASGRFDVVEGPAPRWGARGEGTSLYVRDPDGTVVELRHYATPPTPAL